MATIIDLIQGETAGVDLVLYKPNGVPHNLTGATVTLTVRKASDYQGHDFDHPDAYEALNWTKGAPVLDAVSVTVTTAASGEVTWYPSSTLTDYTGVFYVEFTITDSGGYVTKGPKDRGSIVVRVIPTLAEEA